MKVKHRSTTESDAYMYAGAVCFQPIDLSTIVPSTTSIAAAIGTGEGTASANAIAAADAPTGDFGEHSAARFSAIAATHIGSRRSSDLEG